MKTLVLLLCLAWCSVAQAVSTNAPTFYVRVQVDGDATNELASLLRRELRGLHDVRCTDADYAYTLSAVVVVESAPGRPPHYAVGVVFLAGAAGAPQTLLYQSVASGTSLRELAEAVVTGVDSTVLEPARAPANNK